MRNFGWLGRSTGDERLDQVRNKMYAEAYWLVVLICNVSAIVKIIRFGPDYKLFITELIILVVSSLYIGLRSIFKGVYAAEAELQDRRSRVSRSKKQIISGLVLGLGIAIFFGVRSAVLYGDDSTRLWYFLTVFAFSIIFYIPLFLMILWLGDAAARKASQSMGPKDDEE
ncbi:DUF6773 family protein [Paenibacillus radicis (ex Gao et al. 2016)]|uniref:DUF3278 domain-containing protein n=1 Tax=Paenibacillus radicis (ex Gao et al. 2016) TaxID=1737354 RepID=A0A917M1H5_9BACL|nr:DUF6773 family protein [Paenibacillus radicis (ex Gao et al. 2016)]GGG73139.1 hypothetical protein GCM10010918_31450 [Paenibacillus radicis (ex Gao et al. 2016)]